MSLGECIWMGALVTAISYGVYLIARKQEKVAEEKEQERDNISSCPLIQEEHEARFTREELVDYAELERDMDGYLDKLKSGELEKIGAIKDDKLGVVMMPIDKYERMAEVCRLINESQSRGHNKNQEEAQ